MALELHLVIIPMSPRLRCCDSQFRHTRIRLRWEVRQNCDNWPFGFRKYIEIHAGCGAWQSLRPPDYTCIIIKLLAEWNHPESKPTHDASIQLKSYIPAGHKWKGLKGWLFHTSISIQRSNVGHFKGSELTPCTYTCSCLNISIPYCLNTGTHIGVVFIFNQW